MAKGYGGTRTASKAQTAASRTTIVSERNKFQSAGFHLVGNGYEFSSGEASIELKEYTPTTGFYKGQKRFDFTVTGEEGARTGDLSAENTEKLLTKLSSMTSSEKEKAINNYIRDLFNPQITKTEADAYAHRKKYLGI